MSRLRDLQQANPVKTDNDWGKSEAGSALYASLADRVDDEIAVEPPEPRWNRPWLYAAAGFAIVLVAVGLPLVLRSGGPVDDPTAAPFRSAETAADILTDNFVTDSELELAAQATVDCINDQAGLGQGAGWDWEESRLAISFTTNAGERLFNTCHAEHFRQIEFVWAAQNAPGPAEGFYFYGAVVQCTEARTGQDFGELGQDTLGFMSTVGERTVNRALNEARETYQQCFLEVQSQPTYYYFVLQCVTKATGSEYPNLVDAGPGRLTAEHIEVLDVAHLDHPREFELCQRDVAAG